MRGKNSELHPPDQTFSTNGGLFKLSQYLDSGNPVGAGMVEENWFFLKGSQSVGPFSKAQLVALFDAAAISTDTLIWREGAENWLPIGEALTLPAKAVPPPLPLEIFNKINLASSSADSFRSNLGKQDSSFEAQNLGNWTDTSAHPWRRYFARILDTVVNGLFSLTVFSIVFYAVAEAAAERFFESLQTSGGRFIDAMLTPLMAIPINAILVGLTGGSIGKWLFGIRVIDTYQRPIGIKAAFAREGLVWFRGLAMAIPIVSLFTMVKAHSTLKGSGATSWDEDLKLTIIHRQKGVKQTILGFIGIFALILVMALLKILEKM